MSYFLLLFPIIFLTLQHVSFLPLNILNSREFFISIFEVSIFIKNNKVINLQLK